MPKATPHVPPPPPPPDKKTILKVLGHLGKRAAQAFVAVITFIVFFLACWYGSKTAVRNAQMVCGVHDDTMKVLARACLLAFAGVTITIWIIVHKWSKDPKRKRTTNILLGIAIGLLCAFALFGPFLGM